MAYIQNPDTQPGKKGGKNVTAIENQQAYTRDLAKVTGRVDAYGNTSSQDVSFGGKSTGIIGSEKNAALELATLPGRSSAANLQAAAPSSQSQTFGTGLYASHVINPNISPFGGPASTFTLYGAAGGNTANSLETVDKSSGAVVTVAALLNGGNSLAFTGFAIDPTSQIFYGVTSQSSPHNPKSLFTINTTTGACILVAALSGVFSSNPVADITFDSAGNMYGSNPSNSAFLLAINKTTGVKTSILGLDTLAASNGMGLSFMNGTNRLFITDSTNLYEINPLTASVISTVALTGAGANVGSLKFDSSNNLFGGTPSLPQLLSIDPVTGIATPITSTGVFDSLAFKGVPGVLVTLTCATAGSAMRYTLDGTTPTETHGTLYTVPFTVSVTSQLLVVAYKSGLADSNVIGANFH